jgi:hypothetical protein
LRQAKKIFHKPVTFFSAEKHAVKAPRLPRNSPQTHHQSTTKSTRFSAKPPAKTTIHQHQKIPPTKSTATPFVGV